MINEFINLEQFIKINKINSQARGKERFLIAGPIFDQKMLKNIFFSKL